MPVVVLREIYVPYAPNLDRVLASHATSFVWWAAGESNPAPTNYEFAALTTHELAALGTTIYCASISMDSITTSFTGTSANIPFRVVLTTRMRSTTSRDS